MKILLVEDNLIDRMAFLRMMEKEDLNCNIEVADSIENARDRLSKFEYQLIVCDLNLPDGTAFDLSAFFTNNTFVLLSGYVDSELKEKAKHAGIYKVISKTNNLNQFPIIVDFLKLKMGKELINNKPVNKQPISDQSAPMLTHLKLTFDNNSAYIIDIIHTYLNENPKLLSRLSLAAEIDDKQQIAKTAHQLKSGYMMIGLKELENLAAELETNFTIKNKDLNNRIQEIIDQSQQSYLSLNAALPELNKPT